MEVLLLNKTKIRVKQTATLCQVNHPIGTSQQYPFKFTIYVKECNYITIITFCLSLKNCFLIRERYLGPYQTEPSHLPNDLAFLLYPILLSYYSVFEFKSLLVHYQVNSPINIMHLQFSMYMAISWIIVQLRSNTFSNPLISFNYT